jgi:hypothetical protein
MMPYRGTPWVKQGRLMTETGQSITIGSPSWFDWLQTATRFCYSPENSTYRLTARKEKRRQNSYWFGYLKIGRKLHNIYLGKAEGLTKTRLDEACDQLVQKSRQKRLPQKTQGG